MHAWGQGTSLVASQTSGGSLHVFHWMGKGQKFSLKHTLGEQPDFVVLGDQGLFGAGVQKHTPGIFKKLPNAPGKSSIGTESL